MNKIKVRFLVDTGSRISIVPRKFAEEILPSNLRLMAANGSDIHNFGYSVLNIVINRLRRNFSWKFVVADVVTPIIGADFLSHQDISVDLRQRRLIDNLTQLTSKGEAFDGDKNSFPITAVLSNCPAYVNEFLKEFSSVVEPFDGREPPLHNVSHHIETEGIPVACKCRPLHGAKLKAAKDEFAKLTDLGVVRPSKSPWASPIHLVPKGDSWRICGDYRRLNNVTKKDRYPINHVDALRGLLYGKKVFSKMDLVRGYNQIPMDPDSIEKTAVITPFGLYEYMRMPFGLCNACQTFQRCMNTLFNQLPFVFVYIDDLLIFSDDKRSHQSHVRQVFEILAKNGLKVSLEKCSFEQSSVEFLGFDISTSGIKPRAKKCEAIQRITFPKNMKELSSFLGAVGFYRHHIPHFAEIEAPLRNALAKSSSPTHKYDPGDDEIFAFEKLRYALSDVAEQSFIDPSSDEFIICSDASKVSIGAVLIQVVEDKERTIQFYSRKLKDAETRYSTFDRELLAAHDSVAHFLRYIDGQSVTLFTDHQPLVAAFKKKSDCKSDRQSRHFSFLSEHLQSIDYVKGSENIVADFLSRAETVDAVHLDVFDIDSLIEEQKNDPEISEIVSGKSNFERQKWNNKELICENSDSRLRPVVPLKFRRTVFDSLHSIGHPGFKNSVKLISARYWWPKMSADIKMWTKTCLTCQKEKVGRHTKAPLQEIQHPSQRFAVVHIDIVGPLPPSTVDLTNRQSYRYLVTFIDRYTRWIEATPISGISAEEVASAFVGTWVSRFGVPLEVISDQGRQFESELFHELSKRLGFLKLRTTAYHPQCNGLLERQHRSLKAILRCRGNEWLDSLPLALFAMRIMPLGDTSLSPFSMVTGSEVLIPNMCFSHKELKDDPCEFTRKLAEKLQTISFQPTRFEQKLKVHLPDELKRCKKVWVRVDRIKRPLESPYSGPHEVVSRNDKFFKLKYLSGKTENVSVNRLKPVIQPNDNELIVKQRSEALAYRVKNFNPNYDGGSQAEEANEQVLDDVTDALTAHDEDESSTRQNDESHSETENSEKFSNVEKFALKQPFKTRYGRTVKFTERAQINYIAASGRMRRTPKNISHTVNRNMT